MLTIFEQIIIGHLVGDYLLQSKKMAIAKSDKTLNGWLWCLTHCVIYTLCICLFTATTEPIKIILIFMSHFPVDHWSLAVKWLKIIKGRTFAKTMEPSNVLNVFDLSFTAIVYVVVDNTIHILLILIIFKYL